MIIILTQCFPPRIGGIENLLENLSIELSKTHKTLVIADQHDQIKDRLNDKNYNNNLIVKRIGGIKFLRKRKKLAELKKLLLSNTITHIIGDSWKSFELTIDAINLFSVPTICLAHGNELISKNLSKKNRVISTMNKVSHIVCNSKTNVANENKNERACAGAQTVAVRRITCFCLLFVILCLICI